MLAIAQSFFACLDNPLAALYIVPDIIPYWLT